jgi:hypothetical protein
LSATTEKAYRPGLTFKSQTSAHQEIVRGRKDIYSADGTLIDQIRELVAEFATHGAEYQYTQADGTTDFAADIRGHYFNLDAQAEQKGWDEEEKELVARVMLRRAPSSPDFSLWSKAPAPKPWAKYDSTPELDVPVLAEQTGTVSEAIAYESENKNRSKVLKELRALENQVVLEGELTAA